MSKWLTDEERLLIIKKVNNSILDCKKASNDYNEMQDKYYKYCKDHKGIIFYSNKKQLLDEMTAKKILLDEMEKNNASLITCNYYFFNICFGNGDCNRAISYDEYNEVLKMYDLYKKIVDKIIYDDNVLDDCFNMLSKVYFFFSNLDTEFTSVKYEDFTLEDYEEYKDLFANIKHISDILFMAMTEHWDYSKFLHIANTYVSYKMKNNMDYIYKEKKDVEMYYEDKLLKNNPADLLLKDANFVYLYDDKTLKMVRDEFYATLLGNDKKAKVNAIKAINVKLDNDSSLWINDDERMIIYDRIIDARERLKDIKLNESNASAYFRLNADILYLEEIYCLLNDIGNAFEYPGAMSFSYADLEMEYNTCLKYYRRYGEMVGEMVSGSSYSLDYIYTRLVSIKMYFKKLNFELDVDNRILDVQGIIKSAMLENWNYEKFIQAIRTFIFDIEVKEENSKYEQYEKMKALLSYWDLKDNPADVLERHSDLVYLYDNETLNDANILLTNRLSMGNEEGKELRKSAILAISRRI